MGFFLSNKHIKERKFITASFRSKFDIAILKQGKEFTFSATNGTFRIKHSMSCTSTNLIYVITCAICGQNYIGEKSDVLRNRVTVHKQQIRDSSTRMLGVSKRIDECAVGGLNAAVSYLSVLQDS